MSNLKAAPGNFDRVVVGPGGVVLEGWMLSSVPLEQISVFINGEAVGAAEGVRRDDVGKAHPWLPHADACGFRFSGTSGSVRPVNALQLIGADASGPVAGLATLHFLEREPPESFPPVELAKMIGAPDQAAYESQGAKVLADLLLALGGAHRLAAFGNILDWGCGCGRLTRLLIRNFETVQVFGCDIVPQLIAWCQESLPRGAFCLSPTDPPTPYADDFFDLVVGVSVMTHLDRRRQLAWLAEMARILKPGGTFVASTLGEYAFLRNHYQQAQARRFGWRRGHRAKLRRLREAGILDAQPNPTLRGIAPASYYRDVYQTESFTQAHWQRHFEIVDYIPVGMGAFQDLWRLRAR